MLGFLPPETWRFETFTLLVIFTIGYSSFLIEDMKNDKKVSAVLGSLIYVLGAASCIYLFIEIPRLEWTFGSVWTLWDIFFGTVMVVALLDLTRRSFGWALPIVALIFLSYALFGHLLPEGFFNHTGFAYDRTISFLFGPGGIFGIVLKTFVSIIFIFMIFGTFLEKSGVGDFLVNLSFAAAGKRRGGPAKIAVMSSAVLGSVNGNSVANVATTGSITIPLMKKTGYSPSFAGGVEAAASTGGQILPPVMGAGAFIMAEFLQIDYKEIVYAAIIPATLYFLCLYFIVDLEAVKKNLKGLIETPSLIKLLKKAYLLIPLGVLLYALLVANLSVARSGFYAIVVCVIVSWLTKDNKMGPKRLAETIAKGTKATIGIGAMCGAAGIVIGTVSMTGFGNQFSSVVVNLAGDSVMIVAIFTALISIILGMGLPTTAAYVISMSVAVPALVALDIPSLSAHLFVFYFAVVSAITPPIGAAFYTGAAIAEANIMKTGMQAVRVGIVAFTVPFFFIFNPILLLDGSVTEIILAVATASIGIAAISMALQRISFRGINLFVWQSILLGISFIL